MENAVPTNVPRMAAGKDATAPSAQDHATSMQLLSSAQLGEAELLRDACVSVGGAAELTCMLTDRAVHIVAQERQAAPGDAGQAYPPLLVRSRPECCAWSSGGACLVVADCAGALQFISAAGVLLFSQNTGAKPGADGCTFRSIAFGGGGAAPGTGPSEPEYLIAATCAGTLLHFSNIAVAELLRAAAQADVADLRRVRGAIGFARVSMAEAHPEGVRSVATSACGPCAVAVCGDGASGVTLWAADSEGAALQRQAALASADVGGSALRVIAVTPDAAQLLVLCANGALSLWEHACGAAPRLLARYPKHSVRDLVLLSTPEGVGDDAGGAGVLRLAMLLDVGGGVLQLCFGEIAKVDSAALRLLGARECPPAAGAEPVLARSHGATGAAYLAFVCSHAPPLQALGATASGDSSAQQLQLHCAVCAEPRPAARTAPIAPPASMAAPADPPAPPAAATVMESLRAGAPPSSVEAAAQARGAALLGQLAACCTSGAEEQLIDALVKELCGLLEADMPCSSRVTATHACLRTPMPTRGSNRILLDALCRSLSKFTHASVPAGTMEAARRCSEAVDRALWRWDTWGLSHHADTAWDATAWQRFVHADMAQEISALLSRGSIRLATMFWQRHADRDTTLRDCIADLLPLLPTTLTPAAYVPWLREHVLPRIRPQQRQKVEDWLCLRAQWMENNDKAPHRAFELVTLALGIVPGHEAVAQSTSAVSIRTAATGLTTPSGSAAALVAALSTPSFGFRTESVDATAAASGDTLVGLYQQLRHLVYLWDGPKVQLGLFEYTQTTNKEVAMGIIERVDSAEMVGDEIVEHVIPFAAQTAVDTDTLLCEFVQEIGHGRRGDGAVALQRALAALPHIRRTNLRLDAVLALLRGSAPPHSKELWTLVDNALVWAARVANKSCIEKLEEQKRLMQLQETLHAYDALSVDLGDKLQVSRLLQHILTHIDRPSALQDGLQLVAAYTHLHALDTHVAFVQNIILASTRPTCSISTRGAPDTEQIVAVLRSLDSDAALAVGQEVVCFCLGLLADVEEDHRAQTESGVLKQEQPLSTSTLEARSAVHAAEAIVAHLGEQAPCATHFGGVALSGSTLAELQRMKQLQVGFDLVVSPATLRDVAQCKQLVMQRLAPRLEAWCAQANVCGASLPGVKSGKAHEGTADAAPALADADTFWGLTRFAGLLNLDRNDLLGLTAHKAANLGHVPVAVRCCTELFRRVPSAVTAQTIKEVAVELLRYADTHQEIFSIATDTATSSDMDKVRIPVAAASLLRMSAATCAARDLPTCIRLHSVVDAVGQVVSQTEMGDYATLLGDDSDLSRSQDDAPADMPSTRVQELLACDGIPSQWMEMDSAVLQTGAAMQLATRFAVGESTWFESTCAKVSGGRFADDSRALVSFLGSHSAHQLAIGVLAASGQSQQFDPELQREQLTLLLNRTLQSRSVDHSFALGCMLSVPPKVAMSAFQQQMKRELDHHDFPRLRCLARLGVDFACEWDEPEFQQQCQHLEMNAHWFHTFSELDIAFDIKAFEARGMGGPAHMQHKRQLVKPLLQGTGYNLAQVTEFTQYYQIEDPGLMFADAVLRLPTVERPQYQDDLDAVVKQKRVDAEQLADMLEQTIPLLDAFDYAKLQFAHELLLGTLKSHDSDAVTRKVRVLEILRTNKVSCQGQTPAASIDFHALVANPWAVLRSKLSVDSVASLVRLSTPLQLDHDQFYIELIKQMFSKDASKAGLGATTGEGAQRVPDMEEIAPLLSACRSPPVASRAAEWVAKQYEVGDNKLGALELASQFASRWSDGELEGDSACTSPEPEAASHGGAQRVCSGKANKCRIEKLAARTYTTLQLQDIAWLLGSEGLAQMLQIKDPKDLIKELYQSFSIPAFMSERCHRAGTQQRTLHSVVDAIAERHEVDVSRLKRKMLEHWLVVDTEVKRPQEDKQQKASRARATSSIFEPREQEKMAARDAELATRIVYALSRGTDERQEASAEAQHDSAQLKGAVTLLQYAMKQSKVTYRGRLRALRALFMLAPKAIIGTLHERLHGKGMDDLLEFWQLCFCMAEFEDMRLEVHSAEELKGRDKRELVQGLWRSHRQNGRALRLVTTLMLDFGISDCKLWTAVLRQLQENGDHRYLLLDVLPAIARSPVFSRLQHELAPLWQASLMQPVQELCNIKTQQDQLGNSTVVDRHSELASFDISAEQADRVLTQVRRS